MTDTPVQLLVPLSSLLPEVASEVEAACHGGHWDQDALAKTVRAWFDFLGPYTTVRLVDRGPEPALLLEFTAPVGRDPVQGEQLFQQATTRAEKGKVKEALGGFQKLVQQFPEVAKYHRALGQAYLVQQDYENAEDELLRALALDGRDPDALTLLGNLKVRRGRHRDAIPLYERSLALKPNVYALTNLGAALAETGDTAGAVDALRRATEIDPTYPNAWFGLALSLSRLEDLSKVPEAIAALERALEVCRTRSGNPEVWDSTTGLLEGLSAIEAREELPAAQAATAAIILAEESQYGVPIRIESGQVEGALARMEYSWVHDRPYHRIIASSKPGVLREHQVRHELEHLRLTNLARAAGRNRWFGSSAQSREVAIRSIGADLQKLQRVGLPEEAITQVSLQWINGLLTQVYNSPLDLLIEQRILQEHPELHELVYQALLKQVQDAVGIASNKEIVSRTPRQIFRANTAMNTVQALWFEHTFPRRTAVVGRFQAHGTWSLAKRLWELWQQDAGKWEPGAELEWVDRWADLLGLADWYFWQPDP